MPYQFGPARWQDIAWNYAKWIASLGVGGLLGYEAATVSDGIMNYIGAFPQLRIFADTIIGGSVGVGAAALASNILNAAEMSHYNRVIERNELYRQETRAQTRFTEETRAPNAAPNLPGQAAIPGVQPAQPPIPVLPARYRNRI